VASPHLGGLIVNEPTALRQYDREIAVESWVFCSQLNTMSWITTVEIRSEKWTLVETEAGEHWLQTFSKEPNVPRYPTKGLRYPVGLVWRLVWVGLYEPVHRLFAGCSPAAQPAKLLSNGPVTPSSFNPCKHNWPMSPNRPSAIGIS
jgi:hypothetical protein